MKVKHKQRVLIVIGMLSLLLMASGSIAQQRPIFSQYMFNGLALNQAYAGNQMQCSATAVYRDQWVNFDGAPTTKTFSAHTGIKKKKIGVGLMVASEEIGVHKDISLYGYYSYKITMRRGVL